MKTVTFEQTGRVGSIVLVDPPDHALSRTFANDLLAAVHEASSSDIRVLVVRATGPNFGTGGFVPEWPGKDRNWFRTFIAEVNQAYTAIEALRVPTIAAVRGRAVSGHYELVLRCDLIVAADDATFTWVEADTGMAPLAGGVQRLADRVGRGRATAQVLLSDSLTSAEAERIGLVNQVVPGAQLDEAVDRLAERLATGPTRGYAAVRALFKAWSGGGVPSADQLTLDLTMDLFESTDAQGAFAAVKKAAETGGGIIRPTFVGT
ncbi:enoyl-CoA hydratase/isomerase family protein [Streptomyces lunalinharesii]|uniref:Enoyl-CoA hydratase/isomerase family protein n=1 Tax=Streptomyces lunalinharesii TaxID=333384 RepID=A0ABN3S3I3_9ACTN